VHEKANGGDQTTDGDDDKAISTGQLGSALSLQLLMIRDKDSLDWTCSQLYTTFRYHTLHAYRRQRHTASSEFV